MDTTHSKQKGNKMATTSIHALAPKPPQSLDNSDSNTDKYCGWQLSVSRAHTITLCISCAHITLLVLTATTNVGVWITSGQSQHVIRQCLEKVCTKYVTSTCLWWQRTKNRYRYFYDWWWLWTKGGSFRHLERSNNTALCFPLPASCLALAI